MAMIFEDLGSAKVLGAYFNNTWPASNKNLTLKLYTSNTTPSASGGDTAATFTEASGGGYAAITLSNGSWTVSASGGIEQAAYAQQTFTFTGALSGSASIYGYYVVDADNDLIFAERAAASFTPANNGDTYKVTPVVQMSQGTPA
jgi:hypothetical protein